MEHNYTAPWYSTYLIDIIAIVLLLLAITLIIVVIRYIIAKTTKIKKKHNYKQENGRQ